MQLPAFIPATPSEQSLCNEDDRGGKQRKYEQYKKYGDRCGKHYAKDQKCAPDQQGQKDLGQAEADSERKNTSENTTFAATTPIPTIRNNSPSAII